MGNWQYHRQNFYTPNTIIISNGTVNITVGLAKNILDDIIEIITDKIAEHVNPKNSYKKAKLVFSALKLILENKTPPKNTKEDIKIAIDIYKEILNERVSSEKQKRNNEMMALICKWVIECNYCD